MYMKNEVIVSSLPTIYMLYIISNLSLARSLSLYIYPKIARNTIIYIYIYYVNEERSDIIIAA